MAVPKKKTSKSKKKIRRFKWKLRLSKKVKKAISIAKSVNCETQTKYILEDIE